MEIAISLFIVLTAIVSILYLSRKFKINRRISLLISLEIFLFWLFSEISQLVSSKKILVVDKIIYNYLSDIVNPVLTKVFIIITNIAEPINLILLSILISILFIVKKQWSKIGFSVGILGGAIIEIILKHYFHRIRPLSNTIVEEGFSFPSGHAIITSIFFTLLLYYTLSYVKNEYKKRILIASSAALILLVSFSRLYLQVHWFSDVVGGLMVGIMWSIMIIIFDLAKKEGFLKKQ